MDMVGLVFGLNATDETPLYEMPLTFVFRVLGFRESSFCIGVSCVGVLF